LIESQIKNAQETTADNSSTSN